MTYDVITTGRIGVGRCPLQTGVPPARVPAFGGFPGGSAPNVAVAAMPTPDEVESALAPGAVL
ncbi:hypothetical protein ACH4UM_16640 [Streptomyces sp. NPDC020801]|uniref:hypothetical protein n=1 Tax=Streptomyces sp. NPDC020801 TaxID=3365093 RepID=UPI0037A0F47B